MLRSRSATNSTAWLRRTALMVMALPSWVGVGVDAVGSGGDAETAGPGDLLVGGEGQLQEADRLQLTGPLQRAGVDGVEAAGGHDVSQGGLGVGVVAGDQHGGRQRAHSAGSEGA